MKDKEIITKLQSALKEIRDTQGKVCFNFELCSCVSCRSSYTSWAIADEVLNKTQMERK